MTSELLPFDDFIPTKVKTQPWIYVRSPIWDNLVENKTSDLEKDEDCDDEQTTTVGKWLLFYDKRREYQDKGMTHHDYAWQFIKKLVESDSNTSIVSAKCSTALADDPIPRPGDENGVICCYTADYTNKHEVKTAADAIRRALYFPRDMFYKTDNDTRAGKYRCQGNKHVSIYKHTTKNEMYERDHKKGWNLVNV